MQRLIRILAVPLGTTVTLVLLLGSVALGSRVTGLARLHAVGPGALDYASITGTLPELRTQFVSGALGPGLAFGPPGITPVPPGPPGSTTPPGDPSPTLEDHPFTNDDFSDAKPVPSVPYTARTRPDGWTREPGEPSTCGHLGGSAWYRYTPPASGGLRASTDGTNEPISLAVFSGADLGSLTQVGCGSATSGSVSVVFAAVGRQTYYFRLCGPVAGELQFSLDPQGATVLAAQTDGHQGNNMSEHPSISGDGRYVAFESYATNLDPRYPCAGCGIPGMQAYVHDNTTGRTQLVSVSSTGEIGDFGADWVDISANGRYVVFQSNADNLSANDTNDARDVFVRDLLLGITQRVSDAGVGLEAVTPGETVQAREPRISGDGRMISWLTGDLRVVVRDRITWDLVEASVSSSGERANDWSEVPMISPDGRYVVFGSAATNLVSGYVIVPRPPQFQELSPWHVYVHDLQTGETTIEDLNDQGELGNGQSGVSGGASISDGGRYVAYVSPASNLVPGDTNGSWDVFVRDRVRHTTVRASIDSSGAQSQDTKPPQVPGFYEVTSQRWVSISADGRFVAFDSEASNLVAGDSNGLEDVFVHDLVSGRTVRVSISTAGGEGNGVSHRPEISGDGRVIAFATEGANLVPGDRNGAADVVVRL